MTKITYTLDYTDDTGLESYDIYQDERKAGYFEFAPMQSCITAIYIFPEFQGQGIGTQIIQDASNEFGTVYLAPDNENAQRLYERLGSKVDESDQVYNDWGHAHDQDFGIYKI